VEIARWDELQLVQRCKEGSEAAFAELVRRYRPRLFTLAYRLTSDRDTAEDVVQETFVAAFRALDRFEPRPSLAAWLNTIAVRNASRVAARAATAPRASLDALIEDDDTARRFAEAVATDADDPHRAAEAAELRREVAGAMAALPFKYRAAVVTRFVLGLEYAEAAASLEMGLNTYKSHLLRGTRRLRDALAPATGRGPSEPVEVPAAPLAAAVSSPAPALGATAMATRVTAVRTFADSRRSRFADSVSKENVIRG
jgi:RNA polymerase sigma-70 factor (ECF subfamily)